MPAKAEDRPSVGKSGVENLYAQSTLEPNRRAEKLVLWGRNRLSTQATPRNRERREKHFGLLKRRKRKCNITPSNGHAEQACEMQLRNVVPPSASHPLRMDETGVCSQAPMLMPASSSSATPRRAGWLDAALFFVSPRLRSVRQWPPKGP